MQNEHAFYFKNAQVKCGENMLNKHLWLDILHVIEITFLCI